MRKLNGHNEHAPQRTARPLLSVAELARLIGVNPSTLYRAINRGDFPLPIVRFGNRIQVPRAAAEKLIHGSVVATVPGSAESPDGAERYCASCSAPLGALSSCSAGRRMRTRANPRRWLSDSHDEGRE
jgi:excisionase family DNA binding protein